MSNYEAVTNKGKLLLKIDRDADGGIEPYMYEYLKELTPLLYFADRSGEICLRAYAAFEFIEGETLSGYILRRGCFPESLAWTIGGMLADVHARRYDRDGLLGSDFEIMSPIPGMPYGGKPVSPTTRSALLAPCDGRPELFVRLDADSVLCHGDMGFGNILVSGEHAYISTSSTRWRGAATATRATSFAGRTSRFKLVFTEPVVRAFAKGYEVEWGKRLPED